MSHDVCVIRATLIFTAGAIRKYPCMSRQVGYSTFLIFNFLNLNFNFIQEFISVVSTRNIQYLKSYIILLRFEIQIRKYPCMSRQVGYSTFLIFNFLNLNFNFIQEFISVVSTRNIQYLKSYIILLRFEIQMFWKKSRGRVQNKSK